MENLKRVADIRVIFFFLIFVKCYFCVDEVASVKYSAFCRRGVVYALLPWNCSGFIQCTQAPGGRFTAAWMPCPSNLQYDQDKHVCVYGNGSCTNLTKVAEENCPLYPDLKFQHPDSCAMFYNCRQKKPIKGLQKYEDECPYPLLFHQEAQACRPNHTVKCGKRPLPSTKGDYKLTCKVDECTGKATGQYPVPGREFSKEFIRCADGKIVETGACRANDEVFDPVKGNCTNKFEDSISSYCKNTSTAVFEDHTKCSLYINCSKSTHHSGLKPFQTECKYPNLFDPQEKKCKPYDQVMCESRPEPRQPCEYSVGHCFDRPECLPCEAKCEHNASGLFPYKGDSSKFITCKDGRTTEVKSCPLGKSFDAKTKDCERACTCGAEIRALTLAVLNIQKFLAPNGLPVLACDKPLDIILRDTQPTTDKGSAVTSCPENYKLCPSKSRLKCSAGLVFGEWDVNELQTCVKTVHESSADSGLKSPIEIPCVERFSEYFIIQGIMKDEPLILTIKDAQESVLFSMEYRNKGVSSAMNITKLNGQREKQFASRRIPRNEQFELKFGFQRVGFTIRYKTTDICFDAANELYKRILDSKFVFWNHSKWTVKKIQFYESN